ncbi:MAG: TonB-dependent receptor [Deltaproteobacteria bacterium]|nr:TonB-dependent receptor [Deltaproteobacteria bacterium]
MEPVEEGAAVELLLTIGADGLVRDAQILSIPRPELEALVKECIPLMRFEPAKRGDQPISARIRFRYPILPPLIQPTPQPEESEGASSASGSPSTISPASPIENRKDEEVEPSTHTQGEQPAPEKVEEGGSFDEPTSLFRARATVDPPEPGAVTRITLRNEELTTVPGTFGEPLRVVASLPGVVRTPFGLGFFLVRGANFQNTGFFVDGFSVPILYHFGAGPAVISSRLVTRLRFYPGGYPVSLGRFSAGVVALETGMPEDLRSLRFEGEVDLLRASLLLIVPVDRGAVAVAFRRSYYDWLLPIIAPGLYIAYTDYQLRGEYRLDDHLSFSLFAFGSDDVLDQSGSLMGGRASEGSNTKVSYEFQRLIARIDWRLGPDSFIRLSGAFGRNRSVFGSRSIGQADQEFDLDAYELGIRLDVALTIEPWLRTKFGFDGAGNLFGINITAPAPSGLGEYPRPIFDPVLVRIKARAARALPAIYGEMTVGWDAWEFTPGLRIELLRWGTLTDIAPDPRLVVRYKVIPEFRIKGATGLFTQPPQAFQTISQGGNPGLPPQRAWQNSLGIEADLPLGIDVEVNGFYSHMFDIPRFFQRIAAGADGIPRREFFRADQEGRAWGLEVLVRRPIEEGFYGWISYTLSRSERRNPNGNYVPFAFDQTHVLNFALSYAVAGWRFGATFQLATGRPTLTPVDPVYDADANAYVPLFVDRGERLPTFHQLNVRVDRDFDFGFMRGSIYVDVLNAYNGQNSEGLIYQYDYARSVPIPSIPFVPTLGVRGIVE